MIIMSDQNLFNQLADVVSANRELILNLANTNPLIEQRIDELRTTSSTFDLSETSISNIVLNEAIGVLINLLVMNGIEIHTDVDQMIADRAAAEYLITLYNRFIPENLPTYLSSIPALFQNSQSYIANVQPGEYVTAMLEAARDTDPSDYNNLMYVSLYDKIKSTLAYANAVDSIMISIERHDDEHSVSPITARDIDFLASLAAERKWYRATLLNMLNRAGAKVDIKLCNRLVGKFCRHYSLYDNLSVLTNYRELVAQNKATIDQIISSIKKKSEFYVDHYSDEEISKLSLPIVISIILAQFSDKRMFDIPEDWSRLIANADTLISIKQLINLVPTQNKI